MGARQVSYVTQYSLSQRRSPYQARGGCAPFLGSVRTGLKIRRLLQQPWTARAMGPVVLSFRARRKRRMEVPYPRIILRSRIRANAATRTFTKSGKAPRIIFRRLTMRGIARASNTCRTRVGVRPSKWCAGCHDPALLYSGMFNRPIREVEDTPRGPGRPRMHDVPFDCQSEKHDGPG